MVIYHTNDIHGNYMFLKKVHAYLRNNKMAEDIYLDSGDYTDLKNVIVQADKGVLAMELLNFTGIDLMAIGNNEIDLTNEALTHLLKLGCPLISCNLTSADNSVIDGLYSSKILHKEGKSFLVIGLSPYYGKAMKEGFSNVFFAMGNLLVTEPVQAIRATLDDNKGNYDYVILLSHSSKEVDDYIKKEIPEIDFILGGHCHSVITEKGYSQSGGGTYLGKITLDLSNDKFTVVKNEQIDLPEIEDTDFDILLKDVTQRADDIISRELPIIRELSFDAFKECELMNFICDCLYKHFDGDFAIMHHGIAESDLIKPVSKKSLVINFPSKLNPTMYRIKGDKILEAVQMSFSDEHIRQDGKGPGFRGNILGTLAYSHNVNITRCPLQITIDGEKLDPNKTYSIITDDYLQRGSGYPSLKVDDNEATYDIWFIRDMVEYFLMDKEVFESAKKIRIVI